MKSKMTQPGDTLRTYADVTEDGGLRTGGWKRSGTLLVVSLSVRCVLLYNDDDDETQTSETSKLQHDDDDDDAKDNDDDDDVK